MVMTQVASLGIPTFHLFDLFFRYIDDCHPRNKLNRFTVYDYLESYGNSCLHIMRGGILNYTHIGESTSLTHV